MPSTPLLDRLRESVLVADGAMGSLLYSRGFGFSTCYDNLTLEAPIVVREIHLDYLKAGAQILLTNTYGASRSKLAQFNLEHKVREINERGAQLAKQMGGDEVYVAGAVGPLLTKPEKLTPEQMYEHIAEQVTALANGGVDFITLETFVSLDELIIALRAARSVCDLPVFCNMAFSENGATPAGIGITAALRRLMEERADGVGTQANAGPLGTLRIVEKMVQYTELPLLAKPASSMPQYLSGANFYLSHPDYFAQNCGEMVNRGASIVGGCIGTTPADIKALVDLIKDHAPVARHVKPLPSLAARVRPEGHVAEHYPTQGPITEVLSEKRAVIVEVDPPRGLDYRKQITGVQALCDAGIDAVTVADNSLATIRMDALVMSHIYQEECGLRAIMHVSCRDRNLIGMQSMLLGAQAMGVTNILCVTGDPASVGGQEGATSVFDLNSIKLVKLIGRLNAGENLIGDDLTVGTSFTRGVAFDPNAKRLEPVVRRLQKKIEAGADFGMSQPVYSRERAVETYKLTAELKFPLFIGLMPLVSERNALFLHNEVPGISIPADVLARMRGLTGKAARKVGLAISREIIDATWEYAPGYYFIAPFENANHVLPLVEYVREKERATAAVGS